MLTAKTRRASDISTFTMASKFLTFFVVMLATTMADELPANPEHCGKRKEESQGINILVSGGKPAQEYAWPWQVAILNKGGHFCGGSLIDPWWVLTAAHCIHPALGNPEEYRFRVGSNSLENDTDVTQVRQTSAFFTHPDYDNKTSDSDIALFKMKEAFTLDLKEYKVNIICLPRGNMDTKFPVDHNAWVTGWGERHNGTGDYPDELYEVSVPIFDQTKCKTIHEQSSPDDSGLQVTDNTICAGVENSDADACQGDSGGPLVAHPLGNEDQYYLVGIVSWGADCGDLDSTGVYTRVTRFQDWIRPIFNGYSPGEYKLCDQKLSPSIIAAISVISVLMVIFLCISITEGVYLYRK